MKVGIIIPDQHYPLQDQKAIEVVLKAIKLVKPNFFINLGDVGEWESVSAWRYKGKKLPPLEYQLPMIDEDIKLVNKGIDEFDKALKLVGCKEKYILQGNHDLWLDNFVEKYPYMKNYTFEKACKIKERGYKYLEHNVPLKLGKARFIHGVYTTANHTKTTLDNYGVNIIYGHTHDVQRYTKSRVGDGTISAWSIGCLKDMSQGTNKWLRGRPTNWRHAFGIMYLENSGLFRLEVVDIEDGKTTVWGKEL